LAEKKTTGLFATLTAVIVAFKVLEYVGQFAEILSTCAVNKSDVWALALLMSACFAKKGAKFDHVVVFHCYNFLVV
jgi:hypothetical protein